MAESRLNVPQMRLGQKIWQIHWTVALLLCAIAAIGITMLYSAADGSFEPWASRQLLRFMAGLGVMIVVAVIDIRLWLRYAYAFYLLTLALLVAVELFGSVGMGAQRWIDLGVVSLQPSELMKLALVLALARYFHGLTMDDVGRVHNLVAPVLVIAAPVALVFRQPDLGMGIMLMIVGAAMLFIAGVKIRKFAAAALAALAMVPVTWHLLRDYQKERVLTFFNPESDPLGAGYHIIQSKIALGSGGVFGKGLLAGTQSHLNFLPEKQTDFIFTMLAEEFGLIGGLVLLGLYTLLLIYGVAISARSRSQFGRLVGMGVTTTFFLYVFINIAMVMGLIPVVGVPLPLISYGGTAMLTVLFGFGLLVNVYVHRDVVLPRRGSVD